VLGYNRVILIGSLTRDPEIRYNPRGDRVVKITLAIPNERMTTDHFDVVFVSGNQGNLAEKLREGQWVLIEGKMKQRRWKTPEGQSRARVEIIADTIRQIERYPGRQTSHR
jgi:single-strand DNA-binding protein